MGWQVWVATVAGLLVLGAVDLGVIARRDRGDGARTDTALVGVYVALAAAFAAGLLLLAGRRQAGEFVAGYLTEYSLSVDNLFVFLLILTKLQVPDRAQEKALHIGIGLSLALRAGCIVAGAVAVARFSWTFYLLAALLIYTAIRVALDSGGPDEFHEYAVVRVFRRLLPMTGVYHRDRILVRDNGQLVFTPLLIAILAIGVANVVFAVDSIPAIFGLTTDPYVIFTANAFALIGLRQLYFLLASLLRRLRFLNVGLCVILCFIGGKLLLEALRGSGVRAVGPVHLPVVGTMTSLLVIVATLAATAVAGWIAGDRAAP